MEHKTLDHVGRVADIGAAPARMLQTREQRLIRWAELLEREPERRLNTHFQTEYQPWDAREATRVDNSPISVAFADPVLRAAGLQDDSYGEAKRFFHVSDHQLHMILCYCHYGTTIGAKEAALHVRAAAGVAERSMRRMLQTLGFGPYAAN